MSDLKDLNRAVQSAVFPGHHWAQAVREWIGAATERMEGGGGISVECVEADSGYLCTKLAGHEGEHLALGLANGERHHWPKKPASEGGKVEPEFDEVPQQTIGELVRQAASEGGKVECPNHCGEMVYEDMEHYCKPAQPEPVAAEMPESVESLLGILAIRIDALDHSWRPWYQPVEEAMARVRQAHAAQPARAVAMSPELERVLDFAWSQACETDGYTQPRVEADILAVRAQAAEAGKVRLPKVREGISLLIWKIDNAQGAIAVEHYSGMLRSMMVELDAAEGKVAG